MRAAGRMGADRVTVHNLRVVRVDPDNHLLVVSGAVPGAPGGYLLVRKAVMPKVVKVAQVEKPKGKK
jgi:large subunit ribosomal protein L3